MVITRGILTVLHNILGMRISMKMDGHLAIPPKLVHFHMFWSWHLKVYCFRCFRPNRNRDSSIPPNVINGEDSSRNKATHYWGGHQPRGVGKMIIDDHYKVQVWDTHPFPIVALLWGATKTWSIGHVVAVRCVPKWHGNGRMNAPKGGRTCWQGGGGQKIKYHLKQRSEIMLWKNSTFLWRFRNHRNCHNTIMDYIGMKICRINQADPNFMP